MLRDRDWGATGDLTRAQLVMFHALGDQIHLSEEDRRRALNLDDRTWMAWVKFLADGPSPLNRQRKRCCGDWAKPRSS